MTKIDRKSVERLETNLRYEATELTPEAAKLLHEEADTLLALRAALDKAEARVEQAAQEARAVVLQEAADLVWKRSGPTLCREVKALIDTSAAEALERVRQEEREACARRAESYSTCGCGESKCMAEDDCQIERDTAERIAASIRAQGDNQ